MFRYLEPWVQLAVAMALRFVRAAGTLNVVVFAVVLVKVSWVWARSAGSVVDQLAKVCPPALWPAVMVITVGVLGPVALEALKYGPMLSAGSDSPTMSNIRPVVGITGLVARGTFVMVMAGDVRAYPVTMVAGVSTGGLLVLVILTSTSKVTWNWAITI